MLNKWAATAVRRSKNNKTKRRKGTHHFFLLVLLICYYFDIYCENLQFYETTLNAVEFARIVDWDRRVVVDGWRPQPRCADVAILLPSGTVFCICVCTHSNRWNFFFVYTDDKIEFVRLIFYLVRNEE